MTTGKAIATLLAIIVVIGAYLALAALLGMRDYWVGFLFLLQWSLMEAMKAERLPAAVLGAATGIAIASLPAWFAPLIGLNPALGLLTGAALLATFVLIRGWLPLVVNAATMLFLTVATIPHIGAGTTPTDLYLGLISGVIFFGGLALAAERIGRARRVEAGSDVPDVAQQRSRAA